MKTAQVNKIKKLQRGKELAKASFDANCLKELTLLMNSKSIVLSHPDLYNFTITINGHTTFYGRLSGALIKVYKHMNNKNLSKRFESFIQDSGYKNVLPSMPCSLIDISIIEKEVLHES